jgi:hypothetical protein
MYFKETTYSKEVESKETKKQEPRIKQQHKQF